MAASPSYLLISLLMSAPIAFGPLSIVPLAILAAFFG